MTALRRHALVWLSQPPGADSRDDIDSSAAWHAAGRPFVVTRRRGPAAEVGLGFCTTDGRHPESKPRRVAARTESRHVVRVARPPSLAEIARCPAARARAESFDRVLAAASEAGLDVRVYGSWMWQALTAERHVHESSDLDVLIDVADLEQADCAATFLERQQSSLDFRIDGELSFAGLGEVQWREYLQAKPEVLLKSIDSLRLAPRAELGT